MVGASPLASNIDRERISSSGSRGAATPACGDRPPILIGPASPTFAKQSTTRLCEQIRGKEFPGQRFITYPRCEARRPPIRPSPTPHSLELGIPSSKLWAGEEHGVRSLTADIVD